MGTVSVRYVGGLCILSVWYTVGDRCDRCSRGLRRRCRWQVPIRCLWTYFRAVSTTDRWTRRRLLLNHRNNHIVIWEIEVTKTCMQNMFSQCKVCSRRLWSTYPVWGLMKWLISSAFSRWVMKYLQVTIMCFVFVPQLTSRRKGVMEMWKCIKSTGCMRFFCFSLP